MTLVPIHNFCVANTSERCGHGICLPDQSACVCDVGYIEDFTWLMCPNCYLPSTVRFPVLILLAFISILTGMFGVYICRNMVGVPRRLCQGASLVTFFNAAMMIAEILEGRPGRFTLLFQFIFMTIAIIYLLPVLLFSIVSPVLDILRKRQELKRLVRILKMTAVVYCLIVTTFWILFCVFVDDYLTWNLLYHACNIYANAHVLTLCFFIRKWFLRLITQLNEIERSTTISNRSIGWEAYRSSLKLTVSRINFCMPMICISLSTFTVVYFAYGCFPYMFVFFFFMYLTPNVVAISFYALDGLKPIRRKMKSTDKAVLSMSNTLSSVH